jgi:hypothetical protein
LALAIQCSPALVAKGQGASINQEVHPMARIAALSTLYVAAITFMFAAYSFTLT